MGSSNFQNILSSNYIKDNHEPEPVDNVNFYSSSSIFRNKKDQAIIYYDFFLYFYNK